MKLTCRLLKVSSIASHCATVSHFLLANVNTIDLFCYRRHYEGSCIESCEEASNEQYDNRGSITIARCGLSAGVEGPRYFLVKAEKIEHKCFHNFARKHKALIVWKSL